MKVLVISQFYTPDITAAAFRIAETVGHLRTMSNDVEVITTFPHKSEDPEDVSVSKDGVHRVQLPNSENQGFLGYVYLYLSFFFKSIFMGYKVGRKQNPEVIWATSPPIFVGMAGWVLAKILRAKFALDIRDIWPASAVAAGQISDSGFAYKIGRWMEKFLYRHADVISCVAVPMKEYIQQYTDTDTEVNVIYNGVEVSASAPGDTNENDLTNILDSYSRSTTSKKILYAGNFGHVQQLDLLIDAFADLQDAELKEDWEVFFLGGGVEKEHLKNLVESNNLKGKIHFLDPVPKEEVFDYLKSADLLFIHLQDSEVLRLTIPSKVFDYMLADKPLLAGIYGEGKKIIDSVEGNITFKSGNKGSLKEAIKESDKNISRTDQPENACKVMDHYSRKSQSEKLDALLTNHLEF